MIAASRDPTDEFPDARPARPLWLITLADLALLMVGFFVLVQATTLDRGALAQGLRAGFDAAEAPPALPVAAAVVRGFAPGSAALAATPADAIAWARDVARDPRVRLKVAGSVDGSAADTDPTLHSGALLAADRARAVAAALVGAGAIAPDRITIVTADPARAGPAGRRVLVSIAFTGEPK